eukprot:1159941-Pelagomonas_calceolata.AAC.7
MVGMVRFQKENRERAYPAILVNRPTLKKWMVPRESRCLHHLNSFPFFLSTLRSGKPLQNDPALCQPSKQLRNWGERLQVWHTHLDAFKPFDNIAV